MTYKELYKKLEELFPNGFAIDTDNFGQFIIYTGLMDDPKRETDELLMFEEPEITHE